MIGTNKLILLVMVLCIIMLSSVYTDLMYKNRIRYNIEEFPRLVKLNEALKADLESIQKECISVLSGIDKIAFKRVAGNWTNKTAHEYVKKLEDNNSWIQGWTADDDWLNYLIVYNRRFMPDADEKFPVLYKLIKPHLDYFNVIGLSLLRPGGKLPVHVDPDTTFEKNRLVYHFNIYCPNDYNDGGKSNLYIYRGIFKETIEQKTGNHLVFDSGYKHSVDNNNPENRLILYTDFDVRKSRLSE